MEQSRTGASDMREEEDKGGLAPDSKIKTNQRQTQGGAPSKSAPYARRARKRLEAHNAGDMGKTALWEVRCPELNEAEWRRHIGPAEAWRMARMRAEAMDHDAARFLAFGGKKVLLEMRLHGTQTILKFEILGYPIYKYVANRVN